jgi:hypothetical protein
MKKVQSKRRQEKANNEMLPEYSFKNGVRGKHYKEYRKGHEIKINKNDGSVVIQHFTLEDGAVMLEPEVKKYFPDSETVNEALKNLIKLIPAKKRKSSSLSAN